METLYYPWFIYKKLAKLYWQSMLVKYAKSVRDALNFFLSKI